METYIKVADLNKWVAKYFKNKDLISVSDLTAKIEDLDEDIQNLERELKDLKENVAENYIRRRVYE